VTIAVRILIALGFLLGSFLGGWHAHGVKDDADRLKVAQAEAKRQADTAANTFRIQENRDAETLRTGDQLADALRRLRISTTVRATAVPAPGAGACTGRELPNENREALLRLGAEADRLRADYRACREFVDSLK
jgi:hypothetical protein